MPACESKLASRSSRKATVAKTSGGSRNLERGVQSPARFARRKFLGCHAHFRSRERIHTPMAYGSVTKEISYTVPQCCFS